MPLIQDDRIAFSLKIVSSDAEVKALDQAKAQLQVQVAKVQKLDTANKNLFIPVNALINQYQSELEKLNGVVRSVFTEQNIQDSANKVIQNYFFPNDISTSVPSLSGLFNVWTKVKPFALGYGIGKNYSEVYPGSTTKEADLVQAVISAINATSGFQDIENTTGQQCQSTGTCSLPQYLDEATCVAALPTPGVWTPGPDVFPSYPDVVTAKDNLVTAVNNLISFINTELASIVTNDPDSANQTLNNAAINDINNVILAALSTWLGYPDFNPIPGSVTTCIQFYSYNPALLAPTKLHSSELAALTTALNTRLSYISTRTSQISNTILGTISQNITTGEVSGNGLYLKRYNYLTLRLNLLGGSLTTLVGMQSASGAQDAFKQNSISTKAIYQTIVPTSGFKSNANGTATVHLLDASFLSVGDSVFVYAEKQEELKRAIKSISGNTVILNDVVPSKYRTIDKARLYKDLT